MEGRSIRHYSRSHIRWGGGESESLPSIRVGAIAFALSLLTKAIISQLRQELVDRMPHPDRRQLLLQQMPLIIALV